MVKSCAGSHVSSEFGAAHHEVLKHRTFFRRTYVPGRRFCSCVVLFFVGSVSSQPERF